MADQMQQRVSGKSSGLDSTAWKIYNDPRGIGGQYPRGFVPFEDVAMISDWLAKFHHVPMFTLSPAELMCLVNIDEAAGQRVCSECGQAFTPMKYVLPDDDFFAELKACDGDLTKVRRHKGGSFLIHRDKLVLLPYCGCLLYFRRNADGEGEELFPNGKTHLGLATGSEANWNGRKQRPNWPVSLQEGIRLIQFLQDERKQEAQYRAKQENIHHGRVVSLGDVINQKAKKPQPRLATQSQAIQLPGRQRDGWQAAQARKATTAA